jgi:cytochrome c55X
LNGNERGFPYRNRFGKKALLLPLSSHLRGGKRIFFLLTFTLLGIYATPAFAAAAAPDAMRRAALIQMVRQDCGSCHGMKLTGGLGPALIPDALRGKPVEGLAATIYDGRPGTAMPGWKSFLSEAEAHWIAETLINGFPDVPH